jgi:hypothetical protein
MKSFPLIVFDDAATSRLLFSCAHSRAAAIDARIIDEPTVLHKLLPYVPTPKRMGSNTEGDPEAFSKMVFNLYVQYQLAFGAALKKGTALVMLSERVRERDMDRARLQQMSAYVDGSNASFDKGITTAFKTANTVRAVCTVTLAVSASLTGVGGMLIFLGYKGVNAAAPEIYKEQSLDTFLPGGTTFGFAIGKCENGIITIGEAVQEGINRGVAASAVIYRKKLLAEFAKSRQHIITLQNSIKSNAETLLDLVTKQKLNVANRGRMAQTASDIARDRAKLQAARSTGAGLASSATGMRAVLTRGIPIAFLANDIISAANEWYDADLAFRTGKL